MSLLRFVIWRTVIFIIDSSNQIHLSIRESLLFQHHFIYCKRIVQI